MSAFNARFTDDDSVAARRQKALESYRRGLDRQMEEKKEKKENEARRRRKRSDEVPYP